MSNCLFSKIEKDQKSYFIIVSYINMLLGGAKKQDFLHYDNILQHDEIERHNINNGFPVNDNIQSIVWITKYAKSYREYLSAMKWVASIIRVEIKRGIIDEITQQHVYEIIDEYDNSIYPVVECVF